MKSTRPPRSAQRRLESMIKDLSARKTSRSLDAHERVLAARLRKWATDDQQETINDLLKTKGENNGE